MNDKHHESELRKSNQNLFHLIKSERMDDSVEM